MKTARLFLCLCLVLTANICANGQRFNAEEKLKDIDFDIFLFNFLHVFWQIHFEN